MSNTNCCANLLSQSECCEILKKAAGDVDLLKYVIRPVSNNVVGFLGEYYKLLITYRKVFHRKDMKYRNTSNLF